MRQRTKTGVMGAAFTLMCGYSAVTAAQPASGFEASETTTATEPARSDEASSNGDSASSSTEALARKHFETGVTAYESGDFATAADEFTRSYQLKPHPAILLNVAQSELQAARYVEAATHFRSYLEQVDTPDPAGREGFKEARARVAEVTIEAPPGSTLAVDGTPLGQAPLPAPIYLAPGPHEVTSNSSQQSITAEPGATLAVRLDDLHSVEMAPPIQQQAPSTSAGRRPIGEWFVESPVAWAGAGLAAGSLILSGIAAGTASARYGSADDARDQIRAQFEQDGSPGGTPCGPPALNAGYERACRAYLDREDAGDTWKAVSLTTLVVGIAAVGGTVAYYFLDPAARVERERVNKRSKEASSEPTPIAQLVPVAAPEFQGVSIVGTF